MIESFNETRRGFLRYGLAALATLVAAPALAGVPRFKGLRGLAFHNLHTDERQSITYWRDGAYDRGAFEKINHILRDHYSGDVYPINPRLIDLMFNLQNKVGNTGAIEIISGYRSPQTNRVLAQMSDGVARRSYHTRGMAVDLRMPGTPLPKIHQTALAMRSGGVGYYPDSAFVHVDVGPVRMW